MFDFQESVDTREMYVLSVLDLLGQGLLDLEAGITESRSRLLGFLVKHCRPSRRPGAQFGPDCAGIVRELVATQSY